MFTETLLLNFLHMEPSCDHMARAPPRAIHTSKGVWKFEFFSVTTNHLPPVPPLSCDTTF